MRAHHSTQAFCNPLFPSVTSGLVLAISAVRERLVVPPGEGHLSLNSPIPRDSGYSSFTARLLSVCKPDLCSHYPRRAPKGPGVFKPQSLQSRSREE